MANELGDGVVVADDDPVEAETPAKPALDERRVGGHGDARKVVECGHDGGDAGRHGRGEWRQIHLAQGSLADIDRSIIAARGGRTVGAVMLGHRRQGDGCRKVLALKAPHLGLRHAHADESVLARTLRASSPARIPCDVEHGRERHGQPIGRRFLGGLARGEGPQIWLERRRLTERNGKDRAVAVHDVECEQQRNTEPRLLDGQTLHLADVIGTREIQQIADCARPDRLRGVTGDGRTRRTGRTGRTGGTGGARNGKSRRGHGELAEFFSQRHFANEPVDAVRSGLRHGITQDEHGVADNDEIVWLLKWLA